MSFGVRKARFSLRPKRARDERQVAQRDGCRRFDDDRSAERDTGVVPPLDPQLFGLARLGVERDLRRRDAGRRFDHHADDDRVAVRKPAHDSSGIVRRGRAVRADDRVVVLAASHPGGGESCAELYALDRRNREKQVAHRAFDRVEERLAQRGRYAGRGAFDDASDRVLSPQRLLDDFREVVRIVTIVDLDDPAFDLDLATENLLGYDAGRYQPERQPSREVSAAPVVVEAADPLRCP